MRDPNILLKNKEVFNVFDYKFWSVSERIVLGMNKTNNALEGWNRSLKNNIYSKNPSLYEIGNELKKQHAIVENGISKLLIEPSKKFNLKNKNSTLKTVIESYSSYYGLSFLRAVGSLLKLKEI